jgi:hypothetical protein
MNSGKPDESKGSRPVWWGAFGKVPFKRMVTRQVLTRRARNLAAAGRRDAGSYDLLLIEGPR